MNKSRSISRWLVVGTVLIGFAVAGCGVRGPVETPPPKDKERDDAALMIQEPGDRA